MKNKEKIQRYRWLIKLSEATEIPLVVLGFAWLILLVIELIWKLTPFLQSVISVIWVIFILDFLVKFFLSPRKWLFLKKNVLTIISLFIPAFRLFRIFTSLRLLRTIGVIRSIRVIRVIGSINRGMRVLGRTLERRAFGYVVVLTLMICFVGAAAMFAFERETGAYQNYWDALWWTAMLLTTIASESWPQTPEGKAVTLLLGLYSLGVLGYLTAMLASFFIGQDTTDKKGHLAGAKQMNEIMDEVKLLREEISKISKTD
ncbi:MAG: ion transporter [Bacteroidota bacterium]|nr:ion transporter [Bacteroidota bacterium]